MIKQTSHDFYGLPSDKLADTAFTSLASKKVQHAEFRIQQVKTQSISVRDRELESVSENKDIGFCLRVIHRSSWGFASSSDLSIRGVQTAAAQAVDMAETLSHLNQEPVELAAENTYQDTYTSDYEINPFDVATSDKIERLKTLNAIALNDKQIDFVHAQYMGVEENKYFASSAGSRVRQKRVRLQCAIEATVVDKTGGQFETMRTNAPPVGQGWEYLEAKGIYDFNDETAKLSQYLNEKTRARSVKPGKYDLVIDPTNLFLTIHESIGHATELDRALGYEANYAGTSFATLDKLGSLRYGSRIMNVTGDRTAKYGLASVGYDDEGVKAQQFDIIKDGVLAGYQLNRQMALKNNFKRSNGCAYADSFSHLPIQRMPNVSLQPAKEDISIQDLINRVERGIYIVGDKSWSIDMQRYNFQFTGQRFYEIKNGRIIGQLRDVAYQANTLSFWNSLEAVGGKKTYLLGGAFNCGKGQPGQVAPVSHGCPAALFRSVNILNTRAEAKQ